MIGKKRLAFLKNKFIFGVGLILLFLLIVKVGGKIFVVEKIDCRTQYADCWPELEESLHKFLGKNIIFLSDSQLRKAAMSFPRSRQVFIRKLLPSTLVILIDERKPVVSISLSSSPDFFLVDWEGIVLQTARYSNLPVLRYGNRQVVVGENIDEQGKKAIILLAYLAKDGNKAEGRIESDMLIVDLKEFQAIMPLDGDPQILTASLHLILKRATIEGRKIKSVDLRFKNPVIKWD